MYRAGPELTFICPACGQAMPWPGRDQAMFHCTCQAAYQTVLGIPDLRTAQDPYCGNARDMKIARGLLAKFSDCNFNQLLEYYYQQYCPELSATDVARQTHHIQTDSSRLILQLHQGNALDQIKTMLDIGCGTGGALIQSARYNPHMKLVGLDVALRWLVLARKRLDEAGLPHVPLVCANAEQLPLENSTIDLIHGGDMIEHVADALAVFHECGRVLSDHGRAFFLTPNRFSPTREPHVDLYFAGWLPAKIAKIYCKLAGAPPWQGIFTRSAHGWCRLLRRGLARFGPSMHFSVAPAQVGAGNAADVRLVRCYDACLNRSRLFRFLARLFGPILLISIENRPR